MISNENGFTLLEILIVLSLFIILCSIAVFAPSNIYYKTLLKSTAIEIKEALQLAQQLSLDESREYCVELIGEGFRVREYLSGGRTILIQQFNKNISVSQESNDRISYNRNGETGYGKFILVNKKGRKIIIDTLIGTGRVRISNIY